MGVKIKGLDQLKRQLDEMQRKVEKAGGTRTVPIAEVLTPTFLARFSDFESFADLVAKSGFTIESQEDFDRIPQDEWDTFIAQNTQFSSWQDMLQMAGMELLKGRLGFDE